MNTSPLTKSPPSKVREKIWPIRIDESAPDAIIFLPKTTKARKRRYLHASRRRDMALADWVYSVCDDACQLRCIECGGELSQCGEAGPDGEPSLDCAACRMRCDLQIKDARIRELETKLKTLEDVCSPTY